MPWYFNIILNIYFLKRNERFIDTILRGKVMASIFYEVSTRTACSFSAAMERLGGRVIYSNETTSSNKKGETIEDSVQVVFKRTLNIMKLNNLGLKCISSFFYDFEI